MQLEEIDQLRAARSFTGAHKFLVVGKCIECTGFSRIRAPGKRDFSSLLGRTLLEAGCADQKFCCVEIDFCHSNIQVGSDWEVTSYRDARTFQHDEANIKAGLQILETGFTDFDFDLIGDLVR